MKLHFNVVVLGLLFTSWLFLPDTVRADQSSQTSRPQIKLPLQGGVSVNVPRTPEAVAQYLLKMRGIIQQYESVAISTLLGTGGQLQINEQSTAQVRSNTIDLINRIQSIIPPAELKNEHLALAATMANIGNVLNAGPGSIEPASAFALLGNLHQTLEHYHTGVLTCIAYYGLSLQYDPFGAEDPHAKELLQNALSSFTNRMGGAGNTAADLGVGSINVNQIMQMLGTQASKYPVPGQPSLLLPQNSNQPDSLPVLNPQDLQNYSKLMQQLNGSLNGQ